MEGVEFLIFSELEIRYMIGQSERGGRYGPPHVPESCLFGNSLGDQWVRSAKMTEQIEMPWADLLMRHEPALSKRHLVMRS